MGRGSSGITAGSTGKTVTSIVTQGGNTLDLTYTPLVYGGLDKSISKAARTALETQEKKRLTAKREHALLVGDDGSIAGAEVNGGSGSCPIPYSWTQTRGAILTHNHPRGKGEEYTIGGTFSPGDARHFANSKYATIRASAAEGTYSMTKGKNFDSAGFLNYAKSIDSAASKNRNRKLAKLKQDCVNGTITYTQYRNRSTKTFNEMLIEIHNGYIAGQKQYGYTYTLEGK